MNLRIVFLLIIIKQSIQIGTNLTVYSLPKKIIVQKIQQEKQNYPNFVYKESNETYENKLVALSLQQNLFPRCLAFTNIQRQLQDLQVKENTFLYKIIEENITSDGQKYQYNLASYNPDVLVLIQNEINFSITLQKIIPNQVQTYKACYVDYSVNLYIVIQKNIVGDVILASNQNENQYFFKQIPQNITQQAFVDMFQALSILSMNNIILRSIEPSNIITKVKYAQIISSQFEKVQFLFKDFSIAVKDKTISSFKGNPFFAHPYSSFLHKSELVQNEDVYQLCLSILYIYSETNNSEQEDNAEKDLIYQGAQVETIIEEDIKKIQIVAEDQRQQFAEDLVKKIKSNIFNYFKFTNKDQSIFDQEVLQLLIGPLRLQRRVKQIRTLCQENFFCILYIAIQIDIQNIPSAELIYAILKKEELILI